MYDDDDSDLFDDREDEEELQDCPECGEEDFDGHTCGSCGFEAEEPSDEDGDGLIDGVGFADPGGNSALRAATKRNPRNLPCPTCKRPNMLTPADRARGYQCDGCADQDERGGE